MAPRGAHYEDDHEEEEEEQEEEDDIDVRRGESESEEEETRPATARERKKAALYPPIASICSAMGGFEEFRTPEGDIETAYSLGDQVVGMSRLDLCAGELAKPL